jgi:hypothetical protein
MTDRHDAEWLRAAFTETAYDITPSPVPLAAIKEATRARRRRRTAVMTTACGLLLIPVAATAVHLATPPAPAPTVQAASPTVAVRVVAPGERVQAVPGVQLWLTRDGKHSSTPEMPDQFDSVADGNLGGRGVNVQIGMLQGRCFVSGVYTGKGDPATVKVVTGEGTFTGTVVQLAGQPGWGAWYIPRALPVNSTSARHNFIRFVRDVTVSDTAGHTIAALTLR